MDLQEHVTCKGAWHTELVASSRCILLRSHTCCQQAIRTGYLLSTDYMHSLQAASYKAWCVAGVSVLLCGPAAHAYSQACGRLMH